MTMPDGYSGEGKKPTGNSGKNLAGAVIIVVIVLIASVFVGNAIWDVSHEEQNQQLNKIDQYERDGIACENTYGLGTPAYHDCKARAFERYNSP